MGSSIGSMGSFGGFGARVLLVDELLVVDELVVGRRVVDVRGGAVLEVGGCDTERVVLVVAPAPGTIVDVVVVEIVAPGTGHADGAGASRAANFPRSSRRAGPPKTMQ